MRVREILSLLDVKALFHSGILPNIWKTVPKPVHKIPKEQNRPDYGLWMEDQISLGIRDKCQLGGKGCESVVQILKKIGTWSRDVELLTDDGLVSGHPDFYRDDVIVEVKTTEYWPKMRHETIAQICAYSVLSKITKVGLALPLSETVLWYEIKTDLSRFLDLLRNAVYLYTGMSLIYLGVGNHQAKEDLLSESKNIANTLNTFGSVTLPNSEIENNTSFHNDLPVQVFIGNNRSGSVTLPDSEIATILNISSVRRLYIHAPYVLLPSNSDDWMRKHLRTYLDYSQKVNSRGLVVHIGSGTINNLRETLIMLDDLISENCPLMLETSCGEGKEILVNPEDLLEFFLSLDLKRYKICLDSCHVYAAGYDPFKTLDLLWSACPGIIGLIHFNNSAHPSGSKRDRHASIGFIPSSVMFQIKNFAQAHNIDMVRE